MTQIIFFIAMRIQCLLLSVRSGALNYRNSLHIVKQTARRDTAAMAAHWYTIAVRVVVRFGQVVTAESHVDMCTGTESFVNLLRQRSR